MLLLLPSLAQSLLLAAALSRSTALAQSCDNYGISSSAGGSCDCPPGLTGSNCTLLACANPILPQASRSSFDPSLAGDNGATGCANQCTNGFEGPTCTVCTSDQACKSALTGSGSSNTTTTTTTAAGSQATSSAGGLGGTTTSGTDASDAVCNQGAWTWTQGFVSCNVVNPTLQSVFPGTTTLTFQKTPNPSLSLSSPYGSNGTTQAQLWYSSTTSVGGNGTIAEQFFCEADTCTQSNSTSGSGSGSKTEVNWDCTNLKCTCIPGSFFCGGGGSLDLTTTINTLLGPLSISCDAIGTSCAFKQSTLQTLFGSSGLSLSGCSFGECARVSTIDALASQEGSGGGGGANGGAGAGLSGGVIGGLAVLGAIVVGLLGLLAWGLVAQRRARARGRVAGNSSDQKEMKKDPVGMRWNHVSYVLPKRRNGGGFMGMGLGAGRTSSGGGGGKGATGGEDGKMLLDGITGAVEGGTLCAILGPTGAGKSTFVEILAGKRKSGRATGSVELVSPAGQSSVEAVSVGFVDQHDVLPATSTVREALLFAAELRLGDAVSGETKRARVFEILTQLGLLDVADSIIGSSDRRGISGGERRRVSIGLELLAAPAILIADEPTSGLDSSSAMRVVQVLKDLTDSTSGQCTTVIMTIHQPSSRIFYLFDSVMLLGVGGLQHYFGAANGVGPYFAARGRHCPEGWNPADFLLEIAADPIPLGTGSTSSLSAGGMRQRPSQGSDRASQSKETSDTTPVLQSYPPSNGPVPTRSKTKPRAVLLTQFEALAARELRNFKRDWTSVAMHFAVSAIVGLFVGGLYYKVNLTIGGFQSRIGSLFFLGSLLAFSSLSALSNFIHIRSLFLRERAGGYYSPVAWFLSRVVFDIVPLRLLPTIVMSCIVYWMVGLSPTAAHFFKYLLILIEFNVAITLWNLFLAAAIPDSGVAILVSAVLNLFQMAFAGFFVNLASIPAALRWLQWLAPLKYALEALAVNEVSSGLLIKDTLQGVNIQISAALIMETLFGFRTTAYYRDVLVLFAFIAGFAALFCAAVIYRLREVR